MKNPFSEDDLAKAKRGEVVKREVATPDGKHAELVSIVPIRGRHTGRVKALRVSRVKQRE